MKNIIKLNFFLVSLALLLSSCASTNTSVPGTSLFSSKAESDTELGVRYLFGRGVEQNDKEAFYYFKRAADHGDSLARNEVAYLYAAGKGTHKNYEKALFYYQLAAYQGVASAQYNLGLMYAKGLGTRANQIDALKWVKKSAGHGFLPAKIYLWKHKLAAKPHAYSA